MGTSQGPGKTLQRRLEGSEFLGERGFGSRALSGAWGLLFRA